jgi:ParB-like chromosome segregation protein Spo0J
MSASSDSDFESIKLSIQEHRQSHVPIFVNQDRVILDGHLRYKACRELGIKPEIKVRRFENRLEEKKFIIEVNLCRRHLNEFQRSELQRNLESIRLAEVGN